MKQLLYPLALISMVLPAKAERWGCNESTGFSNLNYELHPHPIELVANIEEGTGTIKVQGLPEIIAVFRIKGFDRRWYWVSLDDYYKDNTVYAFIIELDDTGGYYVFPNGTESAQPSKTYWCHKH